LQSACQRRLNAAERSSKPDETGRFDVFQPAVTAYPGNSGGRLFDPESCAVVGVDSMLLIKGTRESALSQPSGITYAIPAVHVKALLDRHP